jgi:large subunit ribosomal protein L11
MAKKPVKTLKLNIEAGKANPAPPIGPALGQAKVNIGEFVTRFNAGTANMKGDIVPVVINVYEDRTFDLDFKAPPVTSMLLKAVGKDKGSGKPNTSKLGSIPKAKIKEIAEKKLKDLNADTVEAAMKIVEGSAKSMGIEVK